jgi:hypothetical protein
MTRAGIDDFLIRHFVAIAGVLALLGYAAVYGHRQAPDPIRSDGYSYYVYLPSWFLHGDATFDAQARTLPGGVYPDFSGIRRWPGTDRWLNPHPMGPALLIAPFFLVAHVLTRWSSFAPDGFSLFYQHAAGLAGLTYMLAGLAVLRRILRRHFPASVVLATLTTMTWGTNLFHYGVYDSVFSHAYSFFLIAVLLWIVEAWWEQPTPGRSIAIGLTLAAIFLTRHTNAIFALIVLLYGVTDWPSLRERAFAILHRARAFVLIGVAGAAGVLPQLVLYKWATGLWLPSPYAALGAGFTFSSPHLYDVLFSVQKGVFFWSPVLLLAIAGWIVARGWATNFVWAAALVLGINTFLIASWFDWQFGGSYGHRGFTDGFALVAVFMASFFAWTAAPRKPLARRTITGAALGFAAIATLLSVVQMIQYWLGVVPFNDTTWDQYRDLFLRFR